VSRRKDGLASLTAQKINNSQSVFVVLILVLFRLTLATGSLLANGAPGMISLSTCAPAAPAAPALRLKGTGHFVAIDGACKSQSHGASSLYLQTKRNVVSGNTSGQLRGTSSRVLKRAAQIGTILLDLNRGLL
jgi:hypothetical protein